MKDGRPFAFAGLSEHWRRGDQVIDSATIFTTTPNPLMAEIHDRMTVILPSVARECWLDPEFERKETLLSVLKPYPEQEMLATPVEHGGE